MLSVSVMGTHTSISFLLYTAATSFFPPSGNDSSCSNMVPREDVPSEE